MSTNWTGCACCALLVSLVATGCRTPGSADSSSMPAIAGDTLSSLTSKTTEGTSKLVAPLATGWNTTKDKLAETWRKEEPSTETSDVLSLSNTPKAPSAKLLTAAGALAEEKQSPQRARQKYQEALEQDPAYLPAHLRLARLHQSQGEVATAVEQYQLALKFHPHDAALNNDLGLALLESGQIDAAVGRLTAATQADPKSTRYRNNLARGLVRAGRDDEAVTQLTELLGPANAHYNVAYLLSESHQMTRATFHLQQALAIDPQLVAAHELLARVHPVAATTGATVPELQLR